MRSFALLLLGGLAVLAALTFLNVVRLEVNATLPPVSKNLNLSVYPLASARWAPSDIYNVTYYGVKFVPGWPELYTVGYFVPRDPGWSARLEAVGRSGAGQYAIALGGQVQITEIQNAGPYVPIAGATPLDWRILATQRFSILARAWFSQGGTTAVQLINFTAEPMAKLYQQTFSCGVSTFSEPFNYCSPVSYSYGWDGASNTTLINLPYQVVTYGPEAWVEVSSNVGNPRPSLRTLVDGAGSGGYGVAALVIDVSGLSPTTQATISIQHLYGIVTTDTRNNLAYIQLQVRRPDGSVVYLYLARDDGSGSTRVYNVMGGTAQYVCDYNIGSGASGCPAGHMVVRLGWLSSSWATFFSGSVYQYVGYGTIEKIALVAVDRGYRSGKWDADFYVYWDNLAISGYRCSLPGAVSVYTRGQPFTNVFIDAQTSPTSPPSLATQVDAYGGSGSPSADWGAAIAVYRLSSPVPAYGTSISVWGRYVRDSADAQNNVAYLSIGVDTDGDGQIDKEYIIYRYDVSSPYSGAIVSAFFRDANGNPIYVCTVSTTGACTTTDPRFVVVNAGTMDSGNNYQWSYTLYEQGAVVAVALVTVDATGYRDGTADDFWVFWDDLTIEYSACPPPAGWSTVGNYVWQSYNYLLVTGSATAYMPLVANALTYVANFTGMGTYAVFDSSLGVIFGVSVSGSSFTALCRGASVPLGSLPAARWVEFRPLSNFGDIIIRDQHGAILARHGCRYTAAPQYVGFRGGVLRVYNVTALG
jgi:hypothetical protein